MLTQAAPTSVDLRRLDPRVVEILDAEPRLGLVLELAANQAVGPRYDRILTYFRLRNMITPLVGWYSTHPDLRNSGDYQLVIETLMSLLPPDHLDTLYPPPVPYRR